MKHSPPFLALLLLSTQAYSGSANMWGCSPPGERRSVLVLVERSAGSYVKLNGQRYPAELTTSQRGLYWQWGPNSVLLSPEEVATIYEQDAAKAQLKCRRLGAD